MAKRKLRLLYCIVLMTVCSAQEVPPQDAARGRAWDDTRGIVFFGRGTLEPGSPPVRGYRGAIPAASPINVFKDFPGLQKAIVFDIAGGPSDSVLLSVILDFGNKALRHVILTYDRGGALRSVWDTSPYMAWAIAPEENGNVFALGTKLLGYATDGKPYPLLNRYDANGKLIGQYLYSNSFQHGTHAVEQGNGRDLIEPSISLHGDRLYIYAPVENEFLVCTTSGTVIRREPLNKIREQIAAHDGVEFVAMHKVAFVDDSRILLSIEEYASGQNMVMPGGVYSVDFETGKWTPIPLPAGAQLIGAQGNNVVALVPSSPNHPAISRFSLPKN